MYAEKQSNNDPGGGGTSTRKVKSGNLPNIFDDDCGLYFLNRSPDYFASTRVAYKLLACQNLCTIKLLLLCPDTGQHSSSAKILISRWKQRQKS